MAAKVHLVKSARKDYPAHGIKKGEPYYWWKFRYGGKHYSKTPPPPSQLTQSEFLSEWLSIGEDLGREDGASFDETMADEYADRLDNLYGTLEDSLSNLPDSLQDAPTGELIQERMSACEEWADALRSLDWEEYDPEESGGMERDAWEIERNERNYDEAISAEPSVD